MKFGMNLLLWTDDPTQDSFFPILESLKGMGFDGVELPIFNLDPARYAALGKRLDALGLARTAVTARGEAANPISPDAAVRAKALAENKLALECCAAVGSTQIAGPYYAALGHFTGAGPTATEWAHGIEGMRGMAEHAGKLGITLNLEFLNRFEIYLLNDSATAAKFAREVGHPACKMMYDTFHANIEEKNILTALQSCADVLSHVHISENDRSTPGQGQIDWNTTFAALDRVGYEGWLTIEAFGLGLPSLAAATKIWRRMFVDELQLARDGLAFMKQRWAAQVAQRPAGRRPCSPFTHHPRPP